MFFGSLILVLGREQSLVRLLVVLNGCDFFATVRPSQSMYLTSLGGLPPPTRWLLLLLFWLERTRRWSVAAYSFLCNRTRRLEGVPANPLISTMDVVSLSHVVHVQDCGGGGTTLLWLTLVRPFLGL